MLAVSYVPYAVLAASVTLLIALTIGALGIAGGRGRRQRLRWQSGPSAPFPNPALGTNPRQVRLRDTDPELPVDGDPAEADPGTVAPGGAALDGRARGRTPGGDRTGDAAPRANGKRARS